MPDSAGFLSFTWPPFRTGRNRATYGGRPELEGTSLVLMTLAVVFAAAPLRAQTPAWIVAIFLLCAAGRLLCHWRGLPRPPAPLSLLLLASTILGLLLSYGTLLGVEGGFGILLVLVSLKLLETRVRRDLQVLALLGFFLALCSLFFEQELGRWLYVGTGILLLTAALIRLHASAQRGEIWRSFRLAGTMLLQALPLVLLLFVFCPRPHAETRLLLGRSFLSVSAMSDRMLPGSIGNLALSSEVAFHARFPDGNFPAAPSMYWRGLVLWQGDGLEWMVGSPQLPREDPARVLKGPEIRQQITLQPLGMPCIFALDRPFRIYAEGAVNTAGGAFRSEKMDQRHASYEAVSRPDNAETSLSYFQHKQALQVPKRVPPDVQDLADSFRDSATSERQIVQNALDYFRKGGFTYSLDPGEYSHDSLRALEEFLFSRRIGFCEHYAGAFCTLMRLAGVPARVVVGYLGGEYNQIGQYFIVRQSDAHAWCEVWIAGSGWLRVDPTSVTAPDRLAFGLQDYLDSRSPDMASYGTGATGRILWRDLRRQASLYWDNLSYQWDLRVLAYDEEAQHAIFTALGMEKYDQVIERTFAAGLFILAGVWLWLRRPRRSRDPAVRGFSRFARRAAAAGVPRGVAEGPLDFTDRLARRFPARAAEIAKVGRIYAALRYGRNPPPAAELTRAVRAVGRLR